MSNPWENNSLELPPEICASDAKSFAAYTIRHRLPHILKQIIRDQNYDADVMGQLEALTTEMMDGTITPLPQTDDIDSALWADYVQPHIGKSWFTAPFFFVEMYFYRRIIEIMAYRDATPQDAHDPFSAKKQRAFDDAQVQTRQLGEWLEGIQNSPRTSVANNTKPLQQLLLANLWANCADLSQLPDTFKPDPNSIPAEAGVNTVTALSERMENVLIENSADVSRYVMERSAPLPRVDIILDNAGIELIADLALADFLLGQALAQRVVLHAKRHPLFVSDATAYDVRFTLHSMANSETGVIQKWGRRLERWREGDRLAIQNHYFWTLPLYFRAMTPELKAELQTSHLWIVKGDANYRRLLDDRHWPISTPVETITPYLSVPCLALRVLKCELLAGMDSVKLNDLELEDDWMTNGTYGIVQFIAPTMVD